jgi:stress-induced morphogen
MLEPEVLRKRLVEAFPDAQVTLTDLTGTQDHYEAHIESEAFRGKSLIAQHQMVYQALGSAMHGPIHALALRTNAPSSK